MLLGALDDNEPKSDKCGNNSMPFFSFLFLFCFRFIILLLKEKHPNGYVDIRKKDKSNTTLIVAIVVPVVVVAVVGAVVLFLVVIPKMKLWKKIRRAESEMDKM